MTLNPSTLTHEESRFYAYDVKSYFMTFMFLKDDLQACDYDLTPVEYNYLN